MANSKHLLPIVSVQPTFRTVISEVDSGIIPSDTFWVSCYKESSPSLHAKVHVQLNEVDRDVVDLKPDDDRLQITRGGSVNSYYNVAFPPLNIPPTKILVPEQEYADEERANPQRPHRITAFDVSPDGSQFATGFHDGSVHIYPVSDNQEHSIRVRRTSKSHLSTVTCVKFFPSSRVLLTAGADFGLTILPADLPPQDANTTATVSPVRTLRGHTRSITSVSPITRGRNILSGSKDGTVRLWDVSNSRQLHCIVAGKGSYTPILSMSLGERVDTDISDKIPVNGDNGDDNTAHDENYLKEGEVDTSDKVVFCALGNGTFEMLDLRTKTSVFQSVTSTGPRHGVALTSIVYSSPRRLLATGSIDGIVTVLDVRSLDQPLVSFYRNSACIEDMAFYSSQQSPSISDGRVTVGNGLVIGTEDGLAYMADMGKGSVEVQAEIIAGDCDAVRAVRVDGNGCIWTASDDGIVRKY